MIDDMDSQKQIPRGQVLTSRLQNLQVLTKSCSAHANVVYN